MADSDWAENLFCSVRVVPHSADFSLYGWSSILSRCGDLGSQYAGTVRKTFFVHSDAIGSVLALTDGSGSVVLQLGYSAFGEPYAKNGSGTFVPLGNYSGNLRGLSRLFTGREYDSETGLYYYRARTYSAGLGRFLQRDPVGQDDQVNPYAYVGNGPLGARDPTGEFIETGWDLANVAYDAGRGIKNVAELTYGAAGYAYASYKGDSCSKKSFAKGMEGDLSDLSEAAMDGGADMLAAMVPGVPAGMTKGARMVGKAGKYGEEAVKWTNHGNKHVASLKSKWGDIVKSTKSGPAKYNP